MIRPCKDFLKRAFPEAHGRWRSRCEERIQQEITLILSQPGSSRPYDSEDIFNRLQRQYPSRDEYKYDAFSTWKRGTERARQLLDLTGLLEPGRPALEVGCGDGMMGHALASFSHQVTLADVEDWRDERARGLPFVCADVCSGLPLDSELFDLVCTYNTFQHLANPAAAWKELLRVCKPGGCVYVEFGPLFAAPWGLHAYRTIHMPYSQFLFSPLFLETKLKEFGVRDLGKERQTLLPLNRWRLGQFQRLWQENGGEISHSSSLADCSHLKIIKEYPDAFRGLELTFEDVTTTGLAVAIKKRLT